MEWKGKKLLIILKHKGIRFSGLCVDESDMFIVLEDDRTGMVRAFAKSELAGFEVQE